jgi:hypothetical protein
MRSERSEWSINLKGPKHWGDSSIRLDAQRTAEKSSVSDSNVTKGFRRARYLKRIKVLLDGLFGLLVLAVGKRAGRSSV